MQAIVLFGAQRPGDATQQKHLLPRRVRTGRGRGPGVPVNMSYCHGEPRAPGTCGGDQTAQARAGRGGVRGDIQKSPRPSSDLSLSPRLSPGLSPGVLAGNYLREANQAPSTALGPLD